MSTYTATFTIKGDDLGNTPSYLDIYIYDDTNQVSNSSSGALITSTITDNLDEYISIITGALGGTITYTLSGPSTWNSGIDTVVTMTFIGQQNIAVDVRPYAITFSTEDYQYALIISAAATLCNECQFIQLTQCGTDDFYLDLGLVDGSYTAYYNDNTSGVIWEQGTNSTTSLGGLYVYQWSGSAGMFNQYSLYTMTLTDSNGDPVSWTVNGIEYNCATITFKVTVNVTD